MVKSLKVKMSKSEEGPTGETFVLFYFFTFSPFHFASFFTFMRVGHAIVLLRGTLGKELSGRFSVETTPDRACRSGRR